MTLPLPVSSVQMQGFHLFTHGQAKQGKTQPLVLVLAGPTTEESKWNGYPGFDLSSVPSCPKGAPLSIFGIHFPCKTGVHCAPKFVTASPL